MISWRGSVFDGGASGPKGRRLGGELLDGGLRISMGLEMDGWWRVANGWWSLRSVG